jgi:hypothetical protein
MEETERLSAVQTLFQSFHVLSLLKSLTREVESCTCICSAPKAGLFGGEEVRCSLQTIVCFIWFSFQH